MCTPSLAIYMAEALKVSGEKYRRIFSEYDPVFVDAVSSAALSLYFGMHREDKPRQTKTGGKD